MIDPTQALILNLRFYRTYIPTLGERQMPNAANVRSLNRFLSTVEVFIMPSKVQKTMKKNNSFGVVFVNYKLAADEKKEFEKWFAREEAAVALDLVEAMSNGVKFSFSENREDGFYLASATMRDESSVNLNCCVTSRSSNWYESICMCVFKMQRLTYEQSWPDQAGSDSWG